MPTQILRPALRTVGYSVTEDLSEKQLWRLARSSPAMHQADVGDTKSKGSRCGFLSVYVGEMRKHVFVGLSVKYVFFFVIS